MLITTGGVFVNEFLNSSDNVTLGYTIVANDLVLYGINLPKHSKVPGFTSKIDVEVHRRCVCVCVCVRNFTFFVLISTLYMYFDLHWILWLTKLCNQLFSPTGTASST